MSRDWKQFKVRVIRDDNQPIRLMNMSLDERNQQWYFSMPLARSLHKQLGKAITLVEEGDVVDFELGED